MDKVFDYFLCVYILLSLVAFGEWRKRSKDQKLRELVAWVAIRTGELTDAISCAQHIDSVDDVCKVIGDQEWMYVREIITEYQKDIAQKYLIGRQIAVKSKPELYQEEYFMYTFYVFLSQHQADYEFIGYRMSLDFGTTLHKLHYIAFVYCKNNEKLKHKVGYWTEEELKNVIYERVKK